MLGVDPATNIAAIAERADVPTRVGFFGTALAEEIVAERGPAAVVFARNVLPHVADPNDFLRGLCLAMAHQTECSSSRCTTDPRSSKGYYDSIYHEHLCYFTLSTLGSLLRSHGLAVVALDRSPISGGSLVVTAVREGTMPVAPAVVDRMRLEGTRRLNDGETWRDFASRAAMHATALAAALADEEAAGRSVAGYGASARSATMINYARLGPMLDRIADQNEMKQGFYSPGAHVPICSPEALMASAPGTVVVLAWNFFEEIADVLRGTLSFTGRIIKPLPEVTIYP